MNTWRDLRETSMAKKNFQVLQEQVLSRPGAAERIEQLKQENLADIALHDLRRRRALSQQELAGRLHVRQPAISKIESGDDLRLSTLRNYIEALGGELELRVYLDDEELTLTIGDTERTSR
jgi:DNA-binding XRE family transcriptional regulator